MDAGPVLIMHVAYAVKCFEDFCQPKAQYQLHPLRRQVISEGAKLA
jgi:hypothetical protein